MWRMCNETPGRYTSSTWDFELFSGHAGRRARPGVPLAVPLLAGPGAIGTTIIAAQTGGVAHNAALLGCIALVCAVLWVVLRLADAVGQKLGTTGLNIATRLLGLLLAAIAIETMADGLKVLFSGLTSA